MHKKMQKVPEKPAEQQNPLKTKTLKNIKQNMKNMENGNREIKESNK